jgi:hypothetical protein
MHWLNTTRPRASAAGSTARPRRQREGAGARAFERASSRAIVARRHAFADSSTALTTSTSCPAPRPALTVSTSYSAGAIVACPTCDVGHPSDLFAEPSSPAVNGDCLLSRGRHLSTSTIDRPPPRPRRRLEGGLENGRWWVPRVPQRRLAAQPWPPARAKLACLRRLNAVGYRLRGGKLTALARPPPPAHRPREEVARWRSRCGRLQAPRLGRARPPRLELLPLLTGWARHRWPRHVGTEVVA